MFTTVEGVYKRSSIELVETPAGLEEAHVLVTFMPTAKSVPQPQVLYGVWKARMPANQNVDAILKDIRGELAKEWEPGPKT